MFIAVVSGEYSLDTERAAFIIATSLNAASLPALRTDPIVCAVWNYLSVRHSLVLFRLLLRRDSYRVDLALFMLVTRVGSMPSRKENVHNSHERGI